MSSIWPQRASAGAASFDPTAWVPTGTPRPPLVDWTTVGTVGTIDETGPTIFMSLLTANEPFGRVRTITPGGDWQATLWFRHNDLGYEASRTGVGFAGMCIRQTIGGMRLWLAGNAGQSYGARRQGVLFDTILQLPALDYVPHQSPIRALRIARRSSDDTIGLYTSIDGATFIEHDRDDSDATGEPDQVGFAMYQVILPSGVTPTLEVLGWKFEVL